MTESTPLWLAALRGLARGFTYPDDDWVATLLDGQWPEALAAVLEPLGLSAGEIGQAINALPEGPEAALQALQVEYTYLFINAVPHVPAPPYASAYAGEGLLMGEPAEAALVAYRRAGLALANDYHDLPDHIAAELEFLAWLGEQAVAAQESGDEEQAGQWWTQFRAFLNQQVRPWVPAFCRRVEEAARLPFYRELAHLTALLLSVIPESSRTSL
ncbi:MAG: molecular chaperone [Anaerolineae bacterium]